MGAVSAGKLPDVLDSIGPPLAYHVGRAKLAGERDSSRMTSKEDDVLCAEALGRDHATEAYRPIPHDGNCLTRSNMRDDCGVVARTHDVRQREKRWHQCILLRDRERVQSPIRIRNANRFRLCTVVPLVTKKSQMNAGGWKPLMAENAGAIRICEGHYHNVTTLYGAHICPDRLDDADGFVAHPLAAIRAFHGS